MIALIIIAVILLILFLLLKAKLRVELKYIGGKLEYAVKYLFFTVYPRKEKMQKKQKKSITKKKEELKPFEMSSDVADMPDIDESAEKNEELSENKKEKKATDFNMLKVRIEQFKVLWGTVKKFFSKLFKGIKISSFTIDFVISGSDACEAAVNYGKVSTAVYNAIALLKLMFRVSVKSVDIGCDFESKKSRYDFSADITLGLGTAIALLLGALFGYLKNKSKIDELGKSDSDKE